ncbi:MAG: hypothetical protein AMXMBFR47_10970 [Planctomycetota bacterium]
MNLSSKLGLLFLLAVHAPPVVADRPVGGNITADDIWAIADSPILVQADVYIGNSATLTIEPGVEVRFEGDYKLHVGIDDEPATLVARGTITEPILFTSASSSPAPGDWQSIWFSYSSVDAVLVGGEYQSGSILEHAIVEYGQEVLIHSSAPYLSACELRRMSTRGLSILTSSTGDPVTVRSCTIHDCDAGGDGGGAYISGGIGHSLRFTIANCTAGEDGGGIYIVNADDCAIAIALLGNTAAGKGGGLYAVDCQNLSVGSGWFNGVYENTAGEGGGVYFERCNDASLSRTRVANNHYSHVNGTTGGVFVHDSLRVSLVAVPGGVGSDWANYIASNDGYQLFASNSASDPDSVLDARRVVWCTDDPDPLIYDDDEDPTLAAVLWNPVAQFGGDLTNDGKVDIGDLARLLSNYGTTSGATPEDGDFDADEDIDLGDLAYMLSRFGMTCGV